MLSSIFSADPFSSRRLGFVLVFIFKRSTENMFMLQCRFAVSEWQSNQPTKEYAFSSYKEFIHSFEFLAGVLAFLSAHSIDCVKLRVFYSLSFISFHLDLQSVQR